MGWAERQSVSSAGHSEGCPTRQTVQARLTFLVVDIEFCLPLVFPLVHHLCDICTQSSRQSATSFECR